MGGERGGEESRQGQDTQVRWSAADRCAWHCQLRPQLVRDTPPATSSHHRQHISQVSPKQSRGCTIPLQNIIAIFTSSTSFHAISLSGQICKKKRSVHASVLELKCKKNN